MITVRNVQAGQDRWTYFKNSTEMQSTDAEKPARAPKDRFRNYYLEAGAPSQWMGSGLSTIGLTAGAPVTEEAFKHLIQEGAHPVTGDPLGRAFKVPTALEDRVVARIAAELGPDVSGAERASGVERIEREEARKGKAAPVAAFETVFNPPKSVSALWALGDRDVKADLAAAHQAAMASTMRVLERDFARTRVGTNGVAVEKVDGVVAAAFDHWSTRDGDPQLHTHVLIANRVRTSRDGKWRTLDSRGTLMPGVVALSETYDAALRDELTARFGMKWRLQEVSARPEAYRAWRNHQHLGDTAAVQVQYALTELRRDRKNLKWEIDGVPLGLINQWSKRVVALEEEKDKLVATWRAEHGHDPSRATILKWRAAAALRTRKAKQHGESLAAMTRRWRREARHQVGDASRFVERILGRPHDPQTDLRHDDVFRPEDLEHLVEQTTGDLAKERSTWTRANVRATAERVLEPISFRTFEDREQVLARVSEQVVAGAVPLTSRTGRLVPGRFTAADGDNEFEPAVRDLYTARQTWDEERELIAAAARTDGPTATVLPAAPVPEGKHPLSADQRGAVEQIVSSGRGVDVLVGPAGAGKTTTLKELRRQWEAEHGEGSVIGLAPSAAAAQVLADELEIPTENTAKHLTDLELGHPRAGLHQGQLVIVDEAGMSGTHALARLNQQAQQAGAKLLLVGDQEQLAAVDAGGAFGMLTRRIPNPATLSTVHRFKADWEATASIALRNGDTTAIDSYEQQGRIHFGGKTEQIEAALAAWKADTAAGKESLLLAAGSEDVITMNQAAQQWRAGRGELGELAGLIDHDQTAYVGDRIITRLNDRRLLVGDTWVRNGSQYTVTGHTKTGGLLVQDADGATGVLPAEYVRNHVELAYACTVHRAQGRTVDTTHLIVDATVTRGALYVGMTRGREANHAYVDTDPDDVLEGAAHNDQRSYVDVLRGVIANTSQKAAAHDTIVDELDRLTSIRQVAAEHESILSAANEEEFPPLLTECGFDVDTLRACPAWPTLLTTLRDGRANGRELTGPLTRIAGQDLTTVKDAAAVTAARIRKGQSPAHMVAGLIHPAGAVNVADPATAQALSEREHAIQVRAELILDTARQAGEKWAVDLGVPTPGREEQWRAAAVTIAAYRDKWQITSPGIPLGLSAASRAQRNDRAAAQVAEEYCATLSGRIQDPTTPNTVTPAPGQAMPNWADPVM